MPAAIREESSTSTNLLRRVQAQERQAWRQLVDRYGPLIWHWCSQADLGDADRADILQQVFQTVFRKVGDFQRNPASGAFRGWLLIITQNLIRDHWRRQRNRPHATGGTAAHQRLLELQNPDDETPSASGLHPVTLLLRKVLDELRPQFDPRTWQAFWQTAVEGNNSTEVAQSLKMTAGAVRKAKARVLSRLRAELGDH